MWVALKRAGCCVVALGGYVTVPVSRNFFNSLLTPCFVQLFSVSIPYAPNSRALNVMVTRQNLDRQNLDRQNSKACITRPIPNIRMPMFSASIANKQIMINDYFF